MAKLFISYSHKDEDLRGALEEHLAMLKNEGVIEVWHDRRIQAGDNFDHAIDTNLEAADVILLLVSPSFLASRYCYDIEVKRAMERHERKTARVIPVILRPCDWHTAPFGQILATPKDGKPVTKWPNQDEAFLDVVRQIRNALPKTSASEQRIPAAPARTAAADLPRSSNLRLKKHFNDADKDHFLDETFEYMARFFEGSLAELENRHPGIKGRFKRHDANSFSGIIYRDGNATARCSIRYGGQRGFGSGITFSHDDSPSNNSFNESLNIVVTEQALSLRPLGMTMRNIGTGLTMEGAAEFYWSLFIEPLQR